METQESKVQNVTQPSAPTQSPVPEQPKRKSHAWMGWLIFIIVLLAGGAYAAKVYYFDAEDEERLYATLEDNYEEADYEAYLAAYPDGKYADEVKQRLQQIRQMNDEWRTIDGRGTRSDFLSFAERYGDCAKYAHLCTLKLDSLDWVDAQREGTPEAIQRYIDAHPEGRYISEATVLQGNLHDTKVEDYERTAVASALSELCTAIGNDDEVQLANFIVPKMSLFLGKHAVTKADAIKAVHAMHNEHILACQFIMGDDYKITKVPDSDGGYLYNVAFSVDQRIERDNPGKIFASYTATAEVTSDFKVQALSMKEVSHH